MTKTKTTIIGAGEIGQVIGKLIYKNTQVAFWDKNPKKVKDQIDFNEAVSQADFIFLCTTSDAIRSVLNDAKSYLGKHTAIVSVAKGLEETSSKTMNEVLLEFLPKNRCAILGGAMLAEELTSGQSGFGVVGSSNKELFKKLANLFSKTNLYLEYSDDTQGVALAGVLKNIYAIALGIAEGLKWGDNQKGALVARATNEMATIIKNLGGKHETAYGNAGLGDLLATGLSPHSLNHTAGISLATNKSIKKISEGMRSAPFMLKRIEKYKLSLPIFSDLEKILASKKITKNVFTNF